MLTFLKRLSDRLEEWLLGVTLAAMAALSFAQVLARAWRASFSFTEEVSRYLLVWITMLGIAVAAKRGTHIRVHAAALLWPRLRRGLVLFGGVCSCVVFSVLLIYGVKVVWLSHRFQQTEALKWPLWWVGISIPIGGGLALLRTCQACWATLRTRGGSRCGGADQPCGAACQAAQETMDSRSAQPGRLRHAAMTHRQQKRDSDHAATDEEGR